MSNILVINSSPGGENSVSRRLAFYAGYRAGDFPPLGGVAGALEVHR